MDRARQPEAAGRRVAVGGVAEQEHPSDLERLREDGFERPARDLVDLHRQVADSEGAARVGLDLRLGLRHVGGVVEVDDPFLGVRAPALGTHRHHHRQDPALRRVDPADQDVWVGGPLREVCCDVERRLLGDHAEPLVADADELRDAATAVGADKVLAADLVLVARTVVADRRPDAVVVLLERDQLVVEADAAGRQLVGPRLHQRLEADLRKVLLAPRARGAPGLVLAARAPALELGQAAPVVRVGTGEAGVEGGRRHMLGRRAGRPDRLGNADVVEDLHRALVEHVRLRQVGRLRPRADEHVLDPLLGQQHRRHEAGAAATDDQDWNAFRACSGHELLSPRDNDWSAYYNLMNVVSTPILS